MPRLPRPVIAGQPLHVIQRGNNRGAIFVDGDDYSRYRRVLRETSEHAGCAIHAYVLMTNHVHLLMTPDHALGAAYMMQAIGRRYVRYFNDRHERTGTLWEGRFRSTLIDSNRYFFTCSRYVELNPARAGLVSQPGAYRWSSYRCNADGEPDPLVTPHELYQDLGATPADREAAYRAMFANVLTDSDVDAIRAATNANTVLGGAGFCGEMAIQSQRPLMRLPHGGDRRSKGFPPEAISTTLTP